MKNKFLRLSSVIFAGSLFLLASCKEKTNKLETSKYTYANLDGTYAAAAKQGSHGAAPDTYPAVMVETENGSTVPMKMTSLRVDVKVIGNVATTTMHMQFYNNMAQTIEGHMYFPLIEGQTISRFSMDVNGKMREGVVVNKQRGRKGFEAVVRRQIDPGIIEWTKGNNFKARIYPINGHSTKEIIVAYDQELMPVANGYQYRLPFNFEGTIPRFKTKARIYQQSLTPIMDENELEKFEFKRDQEDFAGGVIFKDYKATKPFVFTIPKAEKFRDVLISESSEGDAPYFLVNVRPDLKARPRQTPGTIGLVWDVSNSSTGRNELKELKILKDYLSAVKNTKVQLISFSNDIQEVREFKIEEGNSEELINHLIGAVHDGGTQLGSVNMADYDCDVFVLSSDGITNIGNAEIGIPDKPVLVLNTNVVADHSYLKNVAYKSGGEFINATYLSPEESVDMMLHESAKFIPSQNSGVEATYPNTAVPVHETFALAGRLNGTSSTIDLNFGFGGKVTETIQVELNREDAIPSGLMQKIWAQKKLADLDLNYEANKEAITKLGTEYSIVTRNTSLIVLDRLSDYKMFGIKPPEGVFNDGDYDYDYEAAADNFENDGVYNAYAVNNAFENKLELWNKEFDKNAEAYVNDEDSYDPDYKTESSNESNFSLYMTGKFQAAAGGDGGAAGAYEGFDYDNLSYEEESPMEPSSGAIELKPYDSKRPYMAKIKIGSDDEIYERYLEKKVKYGGVPSFYVDVAAYMYEKGQKENAIKVLSNVGELQLENTELMRVLGKRLEEMGELDLAISVYEDVLEVRGEEPQAYRDLALLYAKNKQYQKAVDLLAIVVNKNWDERFPGIQVLAATDINAINVQAGGGLDLNIDEALQTNMDADLRVVLSWDAADTDVDLWVTDARRERCYSGHAQTSTGGFLSNNYTNGYGPEEFWIKEAVDGKYKVQAKFNGKLPQRIAGPVTVNAKIYTDFGRPNQKMKEVTVRLEKRQHTVTMGEIEF